ncbi:RxLR-like protein [Phytophthora cinnamomi]|uniref:RxLR-like protein n=1 Tax=Phytophthora cinnamomi TaxID=4785 RepID=UPI0035594D48|nr:RxLR-like protein [Phytophthora cinnamomi]
MAALVTVVTVVLLLLATRGSASTFEGELFSPAYYRWFYRWYRGGAWMPHEQNNECHTFTSDRPCTFVHYANNTQEPRVKLAVNTTLAKQLAMLEVKFAANAIAPADFVAVYLVDPQEPNDVDGDPLGDFVDYVYANQSRVDGDGVRSIVFGPLVNMRASYQFKYLRKMESNKSEGESEFEESKFVVLGESPFVEMERGHTEPLQVRLALTRNKGEMRVTWVSGQVFGPNVRFGAKSGRLERRAEATTGTYDALDMCYAPATTRASVFFRHPGYLHDAVMTELVPGERYIYRVGSATGVSSPEMEFIFPTALGNRTADNQRPQSFFVFGDLGTSVLQKPTDELDFDAGNPERHFTSLDMVSRLAKWGDERTVMQRIQQDFDEALRDGARSDTPDYAAVIHIGDLAYAKGTTYLWDQFGAVVQPVASRLPYMVGIGNHEYDYVANGEGHDLSGSEAALSNGWHPEGANFHNDSHGECGVPYARRFHMPEAMDVSSNQPFCWSRSRQQEYGHGRLHIFNASHAHFEFVRARDRVVTDDVWVVSTHDWNTTESEK